MNSDMLRQMARQVTNRRKWMNNVSAAIKCPDCGQPCSPIVGTPGCAECRDCGSSGPVHGSRDWAVAEAERLQRKNTAQGVHMANLEGLLTKLDRRMQEIVVLVDENPGRTLEDLRFMRSQIRALLGVGA